AGGSRLRPRPAQRKLVSRTLRAQAEEVEQTVSLKASHRMCELAPRPVTVSRSSVRESMVLGQRTVVKKAHAGACCSADRQKRLLGYADARVLRWLTSALKQLLRCK